MSILVHCFQEPKGAEEYYDKFCNWAGANSSNLVDPVTVEIGILLKHPIDREAYFAVQSELDATREELLELPDDLRDELWSTAMPHISAIPDRMLAEIIALSSMEIIDDIPFCYVVATHYGNNKLPNDVVYTEAESDSYGTATRLTEYLSRRWVIDQKLFGVGDIYSSFKAYPPQSQRFSEKSASVRNEAVTSTQKGAESAVLESGPIGKKRWWQLWK